MKEFWKYAAAILGGAVVTMVGFWLVHASDFVTRAEAEKIAVTAVGDGPNYGADKRFLDETLKTLAEKLDKVNEAVNVQNSRVGQVEAKLDILIGQGARRASAEVGP